MFIEANLVHVVEKEGKLSERKASPKKYYLADTGLFNVLTGTVNLGSVVENSILLSLVRRGLRPRYHLGPGGEVDFIADRTAWESKYKSRITGREIDRLSSLRGIKERVMVTKDQKAEKADVTLTPLWEFLMEEHG
jgi:predicted AAA+ superfamily ATPase